jgi:hypothetical protein
LIFGLGNLTSHIRNKFHDFVSLRAAYFAAKQSPDLEENPFMGIQIL